MECGVSLDDVSVEALSGEYLSHAEVEKAKANAEDHSTHYNYSE